MSTFHRFEEIQAWQRSRLLTQKIVQMTRSGELSRDFVLRDQMFRAALSIMLNIAEGSGRRTDREFVQFLGIAHGSVKELQCALYVALDCGYADQRVFDDLFTAADEIGRMIYGLSRYLRSA